MTKVQKTSQRSKKARERRQKAKKVRYNITNWKEYNAALERRGSLTLWIDPSVIASWYSTQAVAPKRGRREIYSDAAIVLSLTLQTVYHLPYRQTEGFLRSVFQMMGITVTVPDYSTVNRRAKSVEVPLEARTCRGSVHVVVDSTGVKVYGEGEWKTRQHGISKRRTWKKLHLGIDESSNIILSAAITSNAVDDAAMLPKLLEQARQHCPDGIGQCSADGAYDKMKCYDTLGDIRATIPPRKGAKIHRHGNRKAVPTHPRDENIRAIRDKGRKAWKQESGYHRRSKAEVAMFRYKTIFGETMNARETQRQEREGQIKCRILNLMTHNGMPKSVIRQAA